ncbi:MAG: hypothetical protein M1832_003129 [Thelocarpon impressellum]|nr:MAG: hypothetical protein M1832_003129 [Thelocarpon impressellum]
MLLSPALILTALLSSRPVPAASFIINPVPREPTLEASIWDAQESSEATCSYVERRPHPLQFAQLDFHIFMYGFGSRENRPGQGLLDNMRSAKRGSLLVKTWKAWAEYGTDSQATFNILPTAWVVGGVEGAIWDASGGRVVGNCTKQE